MRNRQQLLDEISLEDFNAFGTPATGGAENAARVATRVRTALSAANCQSDDEVYPSSAFGKSSVKDSSRRSLAPDPHPQSEVDQTRRLKSNFLAAANHELRQPVQALALLLPSVERQVATNPQAIKIIGMMRQALGGLDHMLGAMREISYLDADLIKPRLQAVNVDALLRRLSAEYFEKASLSGLRFRLFAPPALIISDSYLLESTLRCLIENALRFTSCGGVLVGLRRRGERIRIDVVDTGMGVPTERQAEIFEEFVHFENAGRQREKGLGLGLAIASRQATLLGSNIEIHSRLGKGSRFSLWAPKATANDYFAQADFIRSNDRIRVLIVEDDPILRFSLEALAECWGADAVTAADGEDALNQAACADVPFDAIISDYRLGSGMNGVQVVKELERRAGRRFPALILTGETNDASLADIAGSGVALAHKPVTEEELREKLSTLLS